MAMGQSDSALQDFAQAVDGTSRWRMEVPAAHSALTSANTGLNDSIFRSFVEAAAARACLTGSKEWAEKAFQAMELNRTASLRESLALADTWRKNLPALRQPAIDAGDLAYDDCKVGGWGGHRHEQQQKNPLTKSQTDNQADQQTQHAGLSSDDDYQRFKHAARKDFGQNRGAPGDDT